MTFWEEPMVRAVAKGALGGWAGAAAVDYHAFRSWKRIDEARAYDWSTAIFRWVQGAISGALTSAGIGTVFPTL